MTSTRSRVCSVAASLVAIAPLCAQQYRVADPDGNGQIGLGAAFQISENGIIAGLGVPPNGDTRPVTWQNNATTVLPILPGALTGFANDVSETGDVVGSSEEVVQQGMLLLITQKAVIWQNGQPTEIKTLIRAGTTLDLWEGRRINEDGRILGVGRDPSLLAQRPWIFDDGNLTVIGSLRANGSGSVEALDMNEQGVVVGCSDSDFGGDHAFVWQNGVLTDLHDQNIILGKTSTARAINEAGTIVGSADFIDDGSEFETATIWQNGVPTDLGTLGGRFAWAHDINETGTIVGVSTTANPGEVVAFIKRAGEPMTDLNDLVVNQGPWVLANAHAINNTGTIVGEGFRAGALRPFVLTPDGCGTFTIYASGCSGSGGYTPALWGEGCATAGGNIDWAVTNGLGGASGALLFGAGNGSAQVFPGCSLHVLPIAPVVLPFLLAGAGAGAGTWTVDLNVPIGTSAFSLFMQAAVLDPGGVGGLTLTQGLRMDVE